MVATWFITGCSSGFGEIFVRQLRAAGQNVIATGRNAETRLAHLENTGASVLDLDVTAPAFAINETIRQAWGIYPGGIDVVVNNAGFIVSGAIEEVSQDDMESSMKTNFHGPLNITRAVLPLMRARGTGTLMYISSQAAWHPDVSAGSYCASKAALEAAVGCLAKELAAFGSGIRIIMPEPGYFRTKVFANLNYVAAEVSDYAQFHAGVKEFVAQVVGNEPGDPEKAVARMIEMVDGTGMAAGRTVPLRVPLGTDGWGRIKGEAEDLVRICEEWEDVAKSTDI